MDTIHYLQAHVIHPGDTIPDNNAGNTTITTFVEPLLTYNTDTACSGDPVLFESHLLAGDTIFWYAHTYDSLPIFNLDTFQLSNDTSLYIQGVSGDLKYRDALFTTSDKNINFNGNMFDLYPKTDLSLDHIEIKTDDTGFIPVNIYVKSGSYKGYEQSPLDWTLWAQDTVQSDSIGNWMRIHANEIPLTQGDTSGVYVHMATSSHRLHYRSLPQPTVHSTSELDFICGKGVAYQFGTSYSPRLLNTRLHYSFGTNYQGSCATPLYKASISASADSLRIDPNRTFDLNGDTIHAHSGHNNHVWIHLETGDTVSLMDHVFIDSTFLHPTFGQVSLSCTSQDKWGCEWTETGVYTPSTLSMSVHKSELFHISPNPAQEEIRLQSQVKIKSLFLYDGVGNCLMRWSSPGMEPILDISRLPPGLYLIHIDTQSGSLIKKLIIQR